MSEREGSGAEDVVVRGLFCSVLCRGPGRGEGGEGRGAECCSGSRTGLRHYVDCLTRMPPISACGKRDPGRWAGEPFLRHPMSCP